MKTLKIYEEDLKIKDALLDMENKTLREKVTYDFFYCRCYPNFKYVYDKYYTGCTSVIDFISDIYILVMSPGVKSGKRAIENFRGKSSLVTWIQNVSVRYCKKRFKKKTKMPIYEPVTPPNTNGKMRSDIEERIFGTNFINANNINAEDVEKILNLMPNKRYREIIRLLYINGETYDSAAEILGMTKKNFYNKRILAEAQYMRVFKKEERHGQNA